MARSVLADHLRPGDHVVVGQATAEPVGLVEELFALAGRLEPLHVFCGYSLNPAWGGPIDPALRVSAYCGLGTIRHVVGRGAARLLPAQMSQLVSYFESGLLRCDAVLLQVSPADADGWHSLGCAVDYVWAAAQAARVVLVEVNPNVPRTRSSHRLHASRVVVARESDQPLSEVADEAADERQLAIGRNVARLVPDGAVIQLGIGGLAAAIARGLSGHRGLRVRSGMVGDWFLPLAASGAIDADDPDACLASLAVGTRSLYDFCGAGSRLGFAAPAQLVAPQGAAANVPFMAINSAIEVDLRGQANAEFVGDRYVGAVSGQPDYFRAARRSPGGLAILALPAATGGREPKSRIVQQLPGAYVTAAQSDIDVIVTEHGVADLRATTLAERRRLVAALAEPQFRAALAA
ncbi:MAG TPA: acetyl-CoA hydrolase/transferase C-terminal domain-containing protein [Ramlibacter sp.]|nr:acetyl-CoA hydrolase/transferase C-terminal domain-containing protein [Ramlibacter sp.]